MPQPPFPPLPSNPGPAPQTPPSAFDPVKHVVEGALALQEHLIAQLREGKQDPSDVLRRMSRVASLENELLGAVRGHVTARPGEMMGGLASSPFDAEFGNSIGSAETFGATVLREMMTGVRQFVANTQTPQIINSIKSARANGLEKLAVHLERQLYEDLGVEQGEKIMPTVLEDGHILGARIGLPVIGVPVVRGNPPNEDLSIVPRDGDLGFSIGAGEGVPLEGRGSGLSFNPEGGTPMTGPALGGEEPRFATEGGFLASGPPYLCAVCHKVEVDVANGIDTCPECSREEKRQRIG